MAPFAAFIVVLVCASVDSLFAQPDSPIPPEVLHKERYVNRIPKPKNFSSVMLWGIAIADTRVPGYQDAQVEITHTQLSCRVDGKDVVLNADRNRLRGGLYSRKPWFGTDEHEPLPSDLGSKFHARRERDSPVILHVGTRADRVWHFWAASPRASIPPGHLEGCTARVRARISRGALLQIGFDYWRNPTIDFENGANNHEAGASGWYLPSDNWQEAVFTDIKR